MEYLKFAIRTKWMYFKEKIRQPNIIELRESYKLIKSHICSECGETYSTLKNDWCPFCGGESENTFY